jgi:hypothetical protein
VVLSSLATVDARLEYAAPSHLVCTISGIPPGPVVAAARTAAKGPAWGSWTWAASSSTGRSGCTCPGPARYDRRQRTAVYTKVRHRRAIQYRLRRSFQAATLWICLTPDTSTCTGSRCLFDSHQRDFLEVGGSDHSGLHIQRHVRLQRLVQHDTLPGAGTNKNSQSPRFPVVVEEPQKAHKGALSSIVR